MFSTASVRSPEWVQSYADETSRIRASDRLGRMVRVLAMSRRAHHSASYVARAATATTPGTRSVVDVDTRCTASRETRVTRPAKIVAMCACIRALRVLNGGSHGEGVDGRSMHARATPVDRRPHRNAAATQRIHAHTPRAR